MMFIGNELVCGSNARFEICMVFDRYSAYVFVDKNSNTGLVDYVKNIEGSGFTAPPVSNTMNAVLPTICRLFC